MNEKKFIRKYLDRKNNWLDPKIMNVVMKEVVNKYQKLLNAVESDDKEELKSILIQIRGGIDSVLRTF